MKLCFDKLYNLQVLKQANRLKRLKKSNISAFNTSTKKAFSDQVLWLNELNIWKNRQ